MPTLILLGSFVFILWLIKMDSRVRRLPNGGIWFAILWFSFLCSRSPSQWLEIIGIPVQFSEHGNNVDSTVYLLLILGSLVVLARRGHSWADFAANNKALVLIYAYLACTAIWSADPATTAKRVVKDFGSILAALILLTELNPLEVIRAVSVRIAYVTFTLSMVFIKYFPEIGRTSSRSGDNLFGGVTTHKNTLGLVVFVLGLFTVVDLANLWKEKSIPRLHVWIRLGLLALGLWLLLVCDSKTALICLILGSFIFWGAKFLRRLRNPNQLIFRLAALVAVVYALQANFQVISKMMIAVGRDPTMTGRTLIWDEVMAARKDPLLGYGYYSFWETSVGRRISDEFKGSLSTVHNGYLETMVDAGLVGFALLMVLIFGWCLRAMKRAVAGTPMGRLSFVFWCLAMIYNFSETSFFRLDPLWFSLLLMMMEVPRASRDNAAAVRQNAGSLSVGNSEEPAMSPRIPLHRAGRFSFA